MISMNKMMSNTGKWDEQMHENMKEYISEKEAREKSDWQFIQKKYRKRY